MIPNAVTSSATIQSPTSSADFDNKDERENNLALMVGIASLVLEGRPIGDEYEISPCNPHKDAAKTCGNTSTESYSRKLSEVCSVLPSTSNVLRNTSRSNASSTKTQKLYQFEKKSLKTGKEPQVGFKMSSRIDESIDYNWRSNNNEFQQENGFNNTLIKNIRNDKSSYMCSLQTLATSCLQSGPNIMNPTVIFHGSPPKTGNKNKIECSMGGTTVTETKTKSNIQRLQSMSRQPAQLVVGPHCEQFLKKIGLGKMDIFETEEHCCDISYINITCSRWKSYCLKIEAIIKRGLPVCIEVYLGPVNHKILLEQWILHITERAITPNMTLPSLCSAIRSQLYFSQISAWCDLIKKCEKDVNDSGRVITSMTSSAAGDLMQAPYAHLISTPISTSNLIPKSRPRLNIFYRIRHYDSTACFLLKPQVHSFPSVNVNENFSISVCLKSLPRLNGGIPKIGQLISNLTENTSQVYGDKKKHCSASSNFFNTTESAETTFLKEQSTKPCDINMFKSTSSTECFINTTSEDFSQINHNLSDDNNSYYNNQNYDMKTESECSNSQDGLSHREKQLLKYRKRMLKRDKQLRSCFKTNTIMDIPQSSKNNSGNQKMYFHKGNTLPNVINSTAVTKVSIGTQTQTYCKQCGNEKSFSCFICENSFNESFTYDDNLFSEINNEGNKKPSNNAELLLKAIQRTPESVRLKKKSSANEQSLSNKSKKYQQNNNFGTHNSRISNVKIGCRVCKRQKTQHIYNDHGGNSVDIIQNQDDAQGNNKHQTSDDIYCENLTTTENLTTNLDEVFKETVFKTPTEEDQQLKSTITCKEMYTNKIDNHKEVHKELSGVDVTVARLENLSDNQNTPSTICNKTIALRKCLPKINLTPIFCKTQNTIGDQYWKSIMNSNVKELASPSKGACVNMEAFATIQKSNSAPTLPNPITLSPRFSKQSKGRCRHISDRSDRLSFCSDEPYSDDEFENTISSPFASPNKKKHYLGRILPLLGNLEESLLQKRFVPKMEVLGFKVLLGASGGFCPTQLTIPASSYFYELHGETISTPYICEIRLPRKGYAVPRFGTVQVTLLNPTGTVVRMFVVPYDMRDMPPLHCTFVRQRVLAETNTQNNKNTFSTTTINSDQTGDFDEKSDIYSTHSNHNINKEYGHFISAEHMKKLRYCIHLKFQTSRSGRLLLHTDIRLLISRRTDCDTAIAHAKGALESTNDLVIHTFTPGSPNYSMRQETLTKL